MIYGFIDINDVIGQAADGTSVLATRDYTQSKNRKLVQVLTNDELGQKNNFVFAVRLDYPYRYDNTGSSRNLRTLTIGSNLEHSFVLPYSRRRYQLHSTTRQRPSL